MSTTANPNKSNFQCMKHILSMHETYFLQVTNETSQQQGVVYEQNAWDICLPIYPCRIPVYVDIYLFPSRILVVGLYHFMINLI